VPFWVLCDWQIKSVLQSIELRRASWQTAEAELMPWSGATEFYGDCDPYQRCLQITLDDSLLRYLEKALWMSHADDYLRWRLTLHYQMGPFLHLTEFLLLGYVRLGGRLAQVKAFIGMRDGMVWSKTFSIHVEMTVPPFKTDFSECDVYCTSDLAAFAETTVNLAGEYEPPLSALHATYLIEGGGGEGWFGGVSWGRVSFTPDASPSDIRRLMQFDLSCLTRWHPCLTRSDIMPSAWKEYLAELPRN
jgi:hypothetical protein